MVAQQIQQFGWCIFLKWPFQVIIDPEGGTILRPTSTLKQIVPLLVVGMTHLKWKVVEYISYTIKIRTVRLHRPEKAPVIQSFGSTTRKDPLASLESRISLIPIRYICLFCDLIKRPFGNLTLLQILALF